MGYFAAHQPFADALNAGFVTPDPVPLLGYDSQIEGQLRYFQQEYGQELEDCTVVGANLPFDAQILAMKFNIYPRYTIDIFDLARYSDPKQHVSVAEQAKRAGLEAKGDTNKFKGLRWEDMTREQKFAMRDYCTHDVYLETELFRNLLPTISNPKKELWLAHHTLELFTKPRFDFNFPLAREIYMGMSSELKKTLVDVGYTKKELSGTISFAEILTSNLPEGEVPLKWGKPTKNLILITGVGKIVAVADGDEGRKFLLEHPDEKVRKIMEAKIAITSWPKWMKRVRSMAMHAKAFDGKMPVPIRYCGAHTKRWTGTQKINLLNLGGAGRGGSGTHPLISRVRNLLVAPEGFMLGIVDARQIECRLLAWYAGEDKLLTGFKDGKDIYSEFASDLFDEAVHEPDGSETPREQKRLTIQRGFGKDAILGCGYGMGAKTFYDRCYSNPDLRPMFDDGTYARAFIERLIKMYRMKYAKIVHLWSDLEKAFKYVTKFKNEVIEVCDGKLKFYNENGTTIIELPSGSKLYYPHAHVSGVGKYSNAGYEHGKVYGGLLAENIMQSTGRELLIDVIINCEGLLYDVLLHTYDEVVCLICEGDEKRAMRNINKFMCTVPKWASGLPLGSKGFVTKFFKK